MASSREDAALARAAFQENRTRQYIAALEEERRGYVVRGREDRVEQVDAQIARYRASLPGEPAPVEEPEPEQETPRKGRGSAKAALAGVVEGEPEGDGSD